MSAAEPNSYLRRGTRISARAALAVALVTLFGGAIAFWIGRNIPETRLVSARLVVRYLPPMASASAEDYRRRLEGEEDDIGRREEQAEGRRAPLTVSEARERMAYYINSEVASLRSPAMLQPVVAKLLAANPDFAARTLADASGGLLGLQSWLRERLEGWGLVEPADLETRVREIWSNRLAVEPVTEALAFQILCRCGDPQLGTLFLQGVLDSYERLNADHYSRKSEHAVAAGRIDGIRVRIDRLSAQMASLRARTGVTDLETDRRALVDERRELQVRQREIAVELAEAEAIAAALSPQGAAAASSGAISDAVRAHAARVAAAIAREEQRGWESADAAELIRQGRDWHRRLAAAVPAPAGRAAAAASADRGADARARAGVLGVEREVVERALGSVGRRLAELASIRVEYERLDEAEGQARAELADAERLLEQTRSGAALAEHRVSGVELVSPPLVEAEPETILGLSRPSAIGWFGAALSALIAISFFLLRQGLREQLGTPVGGALAPAGAAPRSLVPPGGVGLRNWGLWCAAITMVVPSLFSRESVIAPPVVRDHFAKAMEGLALLGVLLWMWRARWLPRVTLPIALSIVFVGWGMVSGLWVVHEPGYYDQLRKLLYAFGATLALYPVLRTRADLELALLLWKATSFVFAVCILIEIGWPGWRLAGRLEGGLIEVAIGYAKESYRAGGPLGHPNWVGFFLGATLLLQPYFWVRYRSKIARGLLAVCTVLEIYGLIAANVRLGIAGAALGIAWMIARGAFRFRVLPLVLIGFAGFALWPFLPDVVKRRSSVDYMLQDRSVRKRASQQFESLRLGLEHGALGVGYGGYGYTYFCEAQGYAAEALLEGAILGEGEGEFPIENIGGHNAYLEILIEGGLIGLGLFAAMLFALFLGVFTGAHRNKGDPAAAMLGIALEAAVLALAVMLVVLHAQEQRALWTFVALGSAYAGLTRHGLMQEPVRDAATASAIRRWLPLPVGALAVVVALMWFRR
jgi:O-antigen ligase